MTILIVNGEIITLPENFSFPLIQENPYFTRSGTYSYEIEISLLAGNNAFVFNNINRINNTEEWERVEAKLYCNSVLILDGTCITIEVTDTTAKIQLIGDVSEIADLINDDRPISKLDLGEISDSDINKAKINYLDTQDTSWRDQDFCLPMLRSNKIVDGETTDTAEWLNKANLMFSAIVEKPPGPDDPPLPENVRYEPAYNKDTGLISIGNITPMPYLLPYFKKLLTALGYEVEYNYFDNTDERYIFFANQTRTRKWAEMLPRWTIKEFIEEVEKFYNCVIYIVNGTKFARISHFSELLEYDNTVELTRVAPWTETVSLNDDYIAESILDNNITAVKYDFPNDNDEYKLMALDKSIYDNFEVRETDWAWLYNKYQTTEGRQELTDGNCIYRITNQDIAGRDYIMFKNRLREVNRYGSFSESEDITEKEESFKIVPAISCTYLLSCYFPAVESIVQAVTGKIEDAVNDGIPETDKPDNIFIAYMDGLQYLRHPQVSYGRKPRCHFAVATTEAFYMMPEYLLQEQPEYFTARNIKSSLILNGSDGIMAKFHSNIRKNFDCNREYSTEVIIDNIIDVRSKILIDNMLFNILSIEYEITNNGLGSTAKITLVRRI